MDKLFVEIFNRLHDVTERNIEESKNDTYNGCTNQISSVSGDLSVDFHLDQDGNYQYKITKHGFGAKVNLTGKITAPEGEFDIVVSSNDGGGLEKHVKTGEEIKCTVETSFWHKTTITVKIHSNITNCPGHASIYYST